MTTRTVPVGTPSPLAHGKQKKPVPRVSSCAGPAPVYLAANDRPYRRGGGPADCRRYRRARCLGRAANDRPYKRRAGRETRPLRYGRPMTAPTGEEAGRQIAGATGEPVASGGRPMTAPTGEFRPADCRRYRIYVPRRGGRQSAVPTGERRSPRPLRTKN